MRKDHIAIQDVKKTACVDVKSGLLVPEGSGWCFFHLAQLACKAEHWAGVQRDGEKPALMLEAGSVSMGVNTDKLNLGCGKICEIL